MDHLDGVTWGRHNNASRHHWWWSARFLVFRQWKTEQNTLSRGNVRACNGQLMLLFTIHLRGKWKQAWLILLPRVSIRAVGCCQGITGTGRVALISSLCSLVWGFSPVGLVMWKSTWLHSFLVSCLNQTLHAREGKGRDFRYERSLHAPFYSLHRCLEAGVVFPVGWLGAVDITGKTCKFNKCLKSVAGSTVDDSECLEC